MKRSKAYRTAAEKIGTDKFYTPLRGRPSGQEHHQHQVRLDR